MIVEAIDMALAVQGFTVHPAQSFRDTKALLTLVGGNLVAVVAHADMPNQPQPGSLLRMVCKSPPACRAGGLVGKGKGRVRTAAGKSVLLREPFDRTELLAAITSAARLLDGAQPAASPARL